MTTSTITNTARWRHLRRAVLEESGYCGAPGCSNLATTVTHVVPVKDGGDPYDRSNVTPVCQKHRWEKMARDHWNRKT